VNPAVSGLSGGGAVPGVNPAVSGLSGGGAVPGVNPAVSGLSGGGAVPGVNPAVSGLSGGGAVPGTNPSASSTSIRPTNYVTTVPGLAPPAAPPPAAPPAAPAGPAPLGAPAVNSPAAPVGPGPVGPAPMAAPAVNSPAAPVGPGPVGPAPLAAPAVNSPLASPGASSAISGAAPPSFFNPAYGGFNTGPGSGAPGMPFNAAFQGVPPSSFGPGEWMHHPDMGLGPGANAVTPAPPIAPQVAPTPVSPTTAPTAGSGDWHSAIPAEQPPAPQASSPSYSSPAASSSTSTSSPTNAGYMSSTTAPSTSYTGGALPSYGSDLRPPAPSVPAGSPSPPPSVPNPPPTPGSPSTNPAAGSSSGVAHAGPARSDSAAPQSSQQPAPTGIAGKAVAAGAAGAVAGAASADATSRIRLQRIVDAVARQESRLAWAAGDRPDDTTILLTDLADGWIPPGIEIPASVTLLEPGRRRGDLEALLGEVRTAVTHTPDRYVPEADESVPTSPRPRHAPEIEELGWELSSATHWRDGLPRLAHTLAKAASSGTGVDPSEVELLQEQMHDAGERVLDAYPDEIDPKHVGNWQLLAAIEALIRGDKVSANYHLAWFKACMTAPTGPQR
jgi:hypothetical protein